MGASLSCHFRLHHTPSCLGPTWRGLRLPAPHPTHDVDGPGCCQVNLEAIPQRAQSPTTTSYSLQGLQSPSAQTPPHHAPSFPSCPLKSTLLTAARASLQNRNKSLFGLHPPMASLCIWNEGLTPTNPQTSDAQPPSPQPSFPALEQDHVFLFPPQGLCCSLLLECVLPCPPFSLYPCGGLCH